MATEARRATLEVLLSAKNATASAFNQVQSSLAKIRNAGRDAFASVGRVALDARAQILGVVAALGGVQKLIIEPAKFEESLVRISVASKTLENDVDRVRTAIESLAVSTGTNRDDLAAGFEVAAKRAKSFQEALKLVSTANQLATLSGAPVKDTVIELTGVMSGFGIALERVDEVAAKVFATTRQLPKTGGELIGELSQIGPQARDAGLGLDQLLAALATAEKQGFDAGSTLTALRTVLDQIVNPTEKMRDLFRDLGVRTGEQALAGKNLGEVFSTMERNARALGLTIRDLGIGGRGLGGFLAIGAENGRLFRTELEAITRSGVPEFISAFEKVDNTLNSLIDGFKELGKVAALAFGRTQFGDLQELLTAAAKEVDQVRVRAELAGLQFSKWIKMLQPFVETGKVLFATFRVGLQAIDNLVEAIALGIQGNILVVREAIARLNFERKRALEDTKVGAKQALQELKTELAQIRRESDAFDQIAADSLKRLREETLASVDGVVGALKDFGPNVLNAAGDVAKLETQIALLRDQLAGVPAVAKAAGEALNPLAAVRQAQQAGRFAQLATAGMSQTARPFGHGEAMQALDSLQQQFSFSPPDASADILAHQKALDAERERLAAEHADRLAQIAQGARSQIQSSFAGAFDGFVQGTLSAREALAEFLRSISSMLSQLVANRAFEAVFGVAGKGGAGDSLFGGLVNAIFSAKGNVLRGSFEPIKAFAGGGVVTRPTIGVIREAGMNEAVVPLPDGRRIPVKMLNGGGGGTVIHMTVNAMDGPSVMRTLTSAAGRRAIEAVSMNAARTRRGAPR